MDSPNRHPEQAVDLPVGERRDGKAIFISLLRRLLEFSGNKHLTFTFSLQADDDDRNEIQMKYKIEIMTEFYL